MKDELFDFFLNAVRIPDVIHPSDRERFIRFAWEAAKEGSSFSELHKGQLLLKGVTQERIDVMISYFELIRDVYRTISED